MQQICQNPTGSSEITRITEIWKIVVLKEAVYLSQTEVSLVILRLVILDHEAKGGRQKKLFIIETNSEILIQNLISN